MACASSWRGRCCAWAKTTHVMAREKEATTSPVYAGESSVVTNMPHACNHPRPTSSTAVSLLGQGNNEGTALHYWRTRHTQAVIITVRQPQPERELGG